MSFDDELDEGLASLESGDLEGAILHFTRCTSLQPENYNGWLYLGISHTEQGNLDRALEAYKKCTAIDGTLPFAYSNMGIVYQKKRDMYEAVRHFVKAARLDPGDINNRLNLGIAYLKLRNKQYEGMMELKFVLEVDDSIPEAWYHLGLIFMDLDRKEYALHCFEQARRLGFQSGKNNRMVNELKFDGIQPKNPLSGNEQDAFNIKSDGLAGF
ncbi:MAG: tetratricopeptide repeat protein [Promethearchaeota archaeon]